MASKAKPDTIFALKTAGISNHTIAKQFIVTVFDVWIWHTETATTSSKPIPGRDSLIRTKPNRQAVMKWVMINLHRTMSKKTSKLEISRSSVHNIFKHYLRLTAYKEQSILLLSLASKQKRYDRGNEMLAEMQRDVDHIFIWSDEKILTVEAVTHTRIIDWMHVMQGICLKVVVPIYAIWNHLEW